MPRPVHRRDVVSRSTYQPLSSQTRNIHHCCRWREGDESVDGDDNGDDKITTTSTTTTSTILRLRWRRRRFFVTRVSYSIFFLSLFLFHFSTKICASFYSLKTVCGPTKVHDILRWCRIPLLVVNALARSSSSPSYLRLLIKLSHATLAY